jgi:hypothetical protein
MMFLFSREHRAARDFTIAGVALLAITLGIVTALSEGMARLAGRDGQFTTARQQPLPPVPRSAGETTIVRSVLDDPVLTGSIGGKPLSAPPAGERKR